MYDLVLIGRAVTPTSILENGWIAIAAGRIGAVGTGALPEAREIQNYGEALLLPGAVDGQTHAGSQIGFAGMTMTSHAAVMGGVTTIVDMPYDHPIPVTTGAVLADKVAAINTLSVCDVALYGTVPTTPDLGHVQELIDGGVCAFKISAFEAHPDRFPRIGNAATLLLLETLEGTGLPLGLHNEDQELVASTTKRFIAEGRTNPLDHSPSRPPVAELTATANFLELAAATSAHAHIVHISIADGFDMVAAYRERGVHATAEMCVHYLLFDADKDMAKLGGQLKVNPPIRSGEIAKLWGVLERGDATFISSDHSAWPLERKQTASIFEVAAGMPGLEAMVPAFFTAATKRYGVEGAARISADYLSDKPARFFGLSSKGRLEAGYDADIVVLAPQAMKYDAKLNPLGPGWSAYDGQTFSVTPAATFVRGQKAWDGKTVATVSGHYVPRTA